MKKGEGEKPALSPVSQSSTARAMGFGEDTSEDHLRAVFAVKSAPSGAHLNSEDDLQTFAF